MKKLLTIPLAIVVGILSMIGAGVIGMVIIVFEILDRILTPILRKKR